MQDINTGVRRNKLRVSVVNVGTPKAVKLKSQHSLNTTDPTTHEINDIVKKGFAEKKYVQQEPKTEIVENFSQKKLAQLHEVPVTNTKLKILAKNDRILAALTNKVKNPKQIEGMPKMIIHNNNELVNQMKNQIKQGVKNDEKNTRGPVNKKTLQIEHKKPKKFIIKVQHPMVEQNDQAEKLNLIAYKLKKCMTKKCILLKKKLNEKPVVKIVINFKKGDKTVATMNTAESPSLLGALQESLAKVNNIDNQIKIQKKNLKTKEKVLEKNAKIEIKNKTKIIAKKVGALKKQIKNENHKILNSVGIHRTKKQKQRAARHKKNAIKQKIADKKRKKLVKKVIKQRKAILKKKVKKIKAQEANINKTYQTDKKAYNHKVRKVLHNTKKKIENKIKNKEQNLKKKIVKTQAKMKKAIGSISSVVEKDTKLINH